MTQRRGDSHQSNPGDHNINKTNLNSMHGMFMVSLLLFHTSTSRHKKRRWNSEVCKIWVSLCSGSYTLAYRGYWQRTCWNNDIPWTCQGHWRLDSQMRYWVQWVDIQEFLWRKKIWFEKKCTSIHCGVDHMLHLHHSMSSHTTPPFRSVGLHQWTNLTSGMAPALLPLFKAHKPSASPLALLASWMYGKSSLINSWQYLPLWWCVATKVCAVVAQLGPTKELQSIQLECGLHIVD